MVDSGPVPKPQNVHQIFVISQNILLLFLGIKWKSRRNIRAMCPVIIFKMVGIWPSDITALLRIQGFLDPDK
jgi:uncharacterized membrane protein